MSVQKALLCPFHCKPRQSGVSLKSAELENILQAPGNGAEVDENVAISRPRSSKMSVQKALLCPVYCRLRTSGVSLESLGMENIPQVPANLAEVGQNHDVRTRYGLLFQS